MRQSTSITGCVRRLVGRLVGLSVTHLFDDLHVAPYWPTWPCFYEEGEKEGKVEGGRRNRGRKRRGNERRKDGGEGRRGRKRKKER